MPYIPPQQREELLSRGPLDAGELNYAITQLVNSYLATVQPLSYGHLNAAIGALECAKMELYRRVAAPYEDRKIARNGDAYPVFLF